MEEEVTKKRIDKRTGRIRPPEDRARDNAKRLVLRTDHAGLREQLPRLPGASEAVKNEVAESIATVFARDGGGPSVY